MNKWLAIPDETKRNAYIQIAEKTGMSAFAVEKDWWVVQSLSIIFEMEIAEHLVFKGGTSLSKAWKLIKRFSEDVDLAINREFFGFTGELSKNQRDKLRKTAGAYVAEQFFGNLQAKFEEKGFNGIRFELVEEKESDKDRTINVYYPHLIEPPGYLQARVQIEISCRSLRDPFSVQTFTALVDEEYAGREFAQSPIHVPTVNPERTFLEKVFLLHEEFHRPKEKMRVDRLSRHLYDVYQLSKTEFAENALNDKVLYETIVNHRYNFTRIGNVNYNEHQPQTIDPIPIPAVLEAWKADYRTMLEQMIYEKNPPTFDEIISGLTNLKNRINSLPWKFEMKFPVPSS
jgi:predicted nucleotidyltransferase component of viral defense system